MNTEIKTIILRFRDLVTEDTIGEHKSIIDKEKYCWWGWWNKPQEKIPFEVFSNLCTQTENGGLEIYLYNSGSMKLYKANCVDICYNNSDKEIGVPEKEKVPSYYLDFKCKCWFKFESISQVENVEDELHKYSYVSVADFFENGIEAFSQYTDKVIYSGLELTHQPRTIWFVRDRKENDQLFEILLYNAKLVNPTNFDDSFTQLSSDDMLWLSDLHFSNGNEHAYGSDEYQKKVNIALKQIRQNSKICPSAMILTGDYAYKADKNEFDKAKEAILGITSESNIYKSNIIMCPGNHDFGFANSDTGIEKLEQKYAMNYSNFYREIVQCSPDNHFCSIKKFITENFCPIEIISINTLTLQQAQYTDENGRKHKFIGMGQVGEDQLNELEERLKKTEDKRYIRILIMHHNLLPVFYKEDPQYDKPYSGLLDAGSVVNFIFRNKIDIVLHGHVHKQYYKILSNVENNEKQECHIIGLGSSGVSDSELVEYNGRMFAIMSVKDRNQFIFNFYKMDMLDNERLIKQINVLINKK